MELKRRKNNERKIIWADKDSILIVGNMSGQVDETEIKEVYPSSTTALGGLVCIYTPHNVQDADLSLKQMSELLINNAPRLKDLN